MPEGPEIWILSRAINRYYGEEVSKCYGKHLIYNGQDWSFGLTGKVIIREDDNSLEKVNSGIAYGSVKEKFDITELKLGADWLKETDEVLLEIIDGWKTSRKSLGSLMLDQSQISGIGVAWGSEILSLANCKPHLKAREQAERLHHIVSAMSLVKIQITNLYMMELLNKKEDLKLFINKWFKNLYKIRYMNVYKKGKKIAVSGRNWYICE